MIEPLLEAERALSFGLLDRAEQLYRSVAAADPRNSIAVVGLARVALERGDDVGALELARQAREVDPENVAAERLVARLEEVLATPQGAGHPAPGSVTAPSPAPPPTDVVAPAASRPQTSPGPAAPATRPSAKRPSLLDRLRGRPAGR